MMPKIFMKVHMEGGAGGMNLRMRGNTRDNVFDQVAKAELVIGTYNDGTVRVLKDRTEGRTLSGVSSELTISKVSQIIAHSVFGTNDLKMFKEGLAIEIEKAVKETVKKYHKDRR